MLSRKQAYLTVLLLSLTTVSLGANSSKYTSESSDENEKTSQPIINKIIVSGLHSLPLDTIMSTIPYHIGNPYNRNLSSKLIKNIYKLGYFKQVQVKRENLPNNKINLHVILTEKTRIKDVIFNGNKHLKSKTIFEKTDLEKKPAADPQELKKYARAIEKLYAERNYHFAKVDTELKKDKETGKALAIFTIKEGPVAKIKRVRFTGNKKFTGKKLRSLLFTREDWVLGLMDKGGTYNPLAIEQDRYTLENFYQSHGYMNAKVSNATVQFDKKKRDIDITFHIDEGDSYTVKSVKAPDHEKLKEKDMLSIIPIRSGQPYSREAIRYSIEQLKMLWGKQGHIYANIEPSIQPNDEEKTVDLIFYSDPGDVVHLNKINIFGNEKARDKVIRRQFLLEEGDLLTTAEMEASKQRVTSLGFFDMKEGVNWRINRIDDNTTDLDMIVKEIKTGRFEFQANYGGAPGQMSTAGAGWGLQASLQERNMFGLGLQSSMTGRWGEDQQSFMLNLADPYFMDKPIQVGCNAYIKHSEYDELKKTDRSKVQQKSVGGSFNVGFMAKQLGFAYLFGELGFEKIDNRDNKMPTAAVNSDSSTILEYQNILNERFKPGKFIYLQLHATKDTRNHSMHVSNGYQWKMSSRLGVPSFGDNIGFLKLQADGHWYTPLIGQNTLVLHVHGFAGYINGFEDNRIPYSELYNIGGQASVRGWNFGQVGPIWTVPDLVNKNWRGDAIGGKKAFFVNTELIFPIVNDQSMKGVVFYDGGSGWDTPGANSIATDHLQNNKFDYRHSIGIGMRVLNPQPMNVYWGFKLDKRTGESLNEVHFSTGIDF
ncbi:MAG: outer membrane protein insertion porin family [Alteromonas naphthalenivorans]|jgi:outer membrane protein insertion porin family